MKVLKNWLVFVAIVFAVALVIDQRHWIGHYLPSLPERGAMTGLQVVLFSLALSFMWVEVLKWGSVKPFNCMKCMTGWTALILAFTFHVEFWYMYLPVGLMAGAVFGGIKMKWL